MVNGAPREVLNGLPREYIEGLPRGFLKANLRPHPRPDPRPKTRGAAGPEGFWPRVWPRMRQRVCQKKIPRGPSIYSRGSPLRSSRGVLFTTISPRLFHRLSFFPDPEEIKSNKQTNNIKNTANGAPRVYSGEYTWHQSVILTELNLNMQARDLERMGFGYRDRIEAFRRGTSY